MARLQSTLDVVANLALAGAAATILVRPALVVRAARSPMVPKTKELTRKAARRSNARPVPPPQSPIQELVRLADRASAAIRHSDNRHRHSCAVYRRAWRQAAPAAAAPALSASTENANIAALLLSRRPALLVRSCRRRRSAGE